jgi:hypothetical protein
MFLLFQVTQIEFNQRAPAGCRQYYQGSNGVYVHNQLLFSELKAFKNKLGQQQKIIKEGLKLCNVETTAIRDVMSCAVPVF